MYDIIEDCSPYYIKFRYNNLDNDLNLIKSYIPDIPKSNVGFAHHALSESDGEKILSFLPMSKTLNLRKERVSFFITKPGYYYRAHKDGLNTRMSINYMIQVKDDDCLTSWYPDNIDVLYDMDNLSGHSRELIDFDALNHEPLKRLNFKQDELVLFNTEIYHDFDNTKSNNERIVLTLRSYEYNTLYFEKAKERLFG